MTEDDIHVVESKPSERVFGTLEDVLARETSAVDDDEGKER